MSDERRRDRGKGGSSSKSVLVRDRPRKEQDGDLGREVSTRDSRPSSSSSSSRITSRSSRTIDDNKEATSSSSKDTSRQSKRTREVVTEKGKISQSSAVSSSSSISKSKSRDSCRKETDDADYADDTAQPSTSSSLSNPLNLDAKPFDPLAALYSDDFDQCEGLVFQSVSQCESYFNRKEKREKKSAEKENQEAFAPHPTEDEPLLPGEGRMVPIEALPERRYSNILKDPSSSGVIPSRPRRPLRNVLTRMDEVEDGPLSLLRRAVRDGIRIRVWTRAHVYIRGICSGFLVAYDKHVNLAMTDVDEEFLIPKTTRDAEHDRMRKRKRRRRLRELERKNMMETGEEEEEEKELSEMKYDDEGEEEEESCHAEPAPDFGEWGTNETPLLTSSKSKRIFKFGQVNKRHIGQLFIKGDNVVMVSLAVD